MTRIITFIFFIATLGTQAQKFDNPEDLIYSPEQECYFISNTADGQIIKVEIDGSTSNFGRKNLGSHGLEIWNGHLLACFGKTINVLDLNDGHLVKSIDIGQAKFLKDIVAADEKCFFISDFSERKIFKLKITTLNNYELIDWMSTGVIPTGMAIKNEHLYFAQWGQEAGIFKVDLDTKDVDKVLVTNYSNLLSLAIDNENNIYASLWKRNEVLKFHPDLNDDPEIIENKEVLYPGGLYFDEASSTLKMTDLGLDRFNAVPAAEKKVIGKQPELNAFPNPVIYNSLITYHLNESGEVMIQLFNCKGQLVRTVRQQFQEKGENQFLLEKDGLTNGLYFLHLSSNEMSKAMPITFIQ